MNMQRIEEIAEKYQVDPKALLKEPEKYESRPKKVGYKNSTFMPAAGEQILPTCELLHKLLEHQYLEIDKNEEGERM